jgi:hypothetical protein
MRIQAAEQAHSAEPPCTPVISRSIHTSGSCSLGLFGFGLSTAAASAAGTAAAAASWLLLLPAAVLAVDAWLLLAATARLLLGASLLLQAASTGITFKQRHSKPSWLSSHHVCTP